MCNSMSTVVLVAQSNSVLTAHRTSFRSCGQGWRNLHRPSEQPRNSVKYVKRKLRRRTRYTCNFLTTECEYKRRKTWGRPGTSITKLASNSRSGRSILHVTHNLGGVRHGHAKLLVVALSYSVCRAPKKALVAFRIAELPDSSYRSKSSTRV